MISSVTNQGKVRFKFHRGTLHADVFLNFLKRLIKASVPRKIYLIVDNLRVHHALRFTAWVREYRTQIELFYPPNDSPDLNPDEHLTIDLNGGQGRCADSHKHEHLAKGDLTTTRRINRQPQRVYRHFEQRHSITHDEILPGNKS